MTLNTANDPLSDDTIRKILKSVGPSERFATFIAAIGQVCDLYREHHMMMESSPHPLDDLFEHGDVKTLRKLVSYQRTLDLKLRMIAVTYLYLEEDRERYSGGSR